ncbi:MAG: hypothetical protein LBR66_05970 [Candidatus Symbiothrix sp.]|jgi:hypothetical protein|nr:hypothetical protein [Candidatus Symbiothrix sp.]
MNTKQKLIPIHKSTKTGWKYGFSSAETGEITVAPEYEYVSDFSYSNGQYRALLGDHQYLTLDGKIHTLLPDEL